ncbi:hypothetical protein M422DRAFT_260693 [Sphaerobolus stellatus SS14]|uniref:Protein kinase domain-containing protein n=1 Tax=Sphaerobolus stellatus (strain SS14) TaxID=990650 RepID=A0A0C9VGY4_SPHS4|nr:hypothetical protein M422DRAFT_260693 [Sphaerobolus stellatus SS14]
MLIVRRVLRRKQPNTENNGEWISHAMKAAKITAEAAKMIPVAGPFIEGGAKIFCVILEPLQQMKDNKEDFRELTQSLLTFLKTLQQQAISSVPQSQHFEEFQKICSDFKSVMDLLLKDHTQFVATSQSRPIKSYLRSGQIKGMISKYQNNVNALKERLIMHCVVSTYIHTQPQNLVGTSIGPRTDDDDIPEFEEARVSLFHELKQGDINLRAEIKHGNGIWSFCRRMRHPFKEYHASTSANGMFYRTTVKVYEGKTSKEHLKAELRIMAHLRHPNIAQVMGFCKSQYLPAVIFYEDLRPVKVANRYGRLDLTWKTLEHLTTRYQMSCDIQDGVRHMQAKLPSFLKTEKNQHWGVDFEIDIGYTEPGKAQLGIYFGNDNCSLNLTVEPDTGPDFFMASNYSSSDVMIDESLLQALQTQLESRVARSPAETNSLLQNFHSVIPVTYKFFPLDSDKVLLGGVYAQFLPCSTCQRCSVLYPFISSSNQRNLVADFSFPDYNVDDWGLSTASSEVWSSLKQSDKGIRLSFTESHTTEKMTLSQYCYGVNDRERDTLLWNSFLAEICHFKSRFDAICPSSKCKLSALNLVCTIRWSIKLEVENMHGTWPVNELYLFVTNAIISEEGYCQVPDVYWSQCPQGTTRLTAVKLHKFGIHCLPKLTCEACAISFNFEEHSIELLQDFYESCGLDPFSDEVARAAGPILPRHFNLDTKKRKRRSFTGYSSLHEYPKENTFSINDVILDDKPLDHYLGGDYDREFCPLIFNSHLQNVLRLRESNSRLGIRPLRYWAFLAAAEVLPESLRWYDLRTTGHDFTYREVNINPRYAELPSRAQEFRSMSVRLGISVDEYLRRWEDYLVSKDAHPILWRLIFPESFDTDE